MILKALLVSAVAVFAAQRAVAQTSFASASVTILPADPAMRPVPASGFGASYNPEIATNRKSGKQQKRLRSALTHGGNIPEGLVLRHPAGETYNTHVLRAHQSARSADAVLPVPDAVVLLE